MKQTVVVIVALGVGFAAGKWIVGTIVSVPVLPDHGVLVDWTQAGSEFGVALLWSLFVAVVAAGACRLLPHAWRSAVLGVVLSAAVAVGALLIQRERPAQGFRVSRELMDTGVSAVTMESLHLVRTAILGIAALLVSTLGLHWPQRSPR